MSLLSDTGTRVSDARGR